MLLNTALLSLGVTDPQHQKISHWSLIPRVENLGSPDIGVVPGIEADAGAMAVPGTGGSSGTLSRRKGVC